MISPSVKPSGFDTSLVRGRLWQKHRAFRTCRAAGGPAATPTKPNTQAAPISPARPNGSYAVSGSGAKGKAGRCEEAAVRYNRQQLFWGRCPPVAGVHRSTESKTRPPRGQSFHEKRPLGKKKDYWKSPIKWNMAIIPPPGGKGTWQFRHTPTTSSLSNR